MNRKYKLYIIRHGATAGNLEGRYVGQTDEGLLEEAKIKLREVSAGLSLQRPDIVLTSPLKRCIETAELLFPDAARVMVDGFSECSFGKFEYMNYAELNGNPDYQLYIDSGGNVAFPGGEDRKSFQERCVKAFTLVMDSILTSQSPEIIAMVVHSGTIMALMDCFAVPHRDYFDWRVQNGEGYEAWLDASYYKGADEKSGRWDFSIMGAAKMGNIK